KNLDAGDAVRLAGADPDSSQRDLFEAIARGDFPQWDVSVQVAREQQLADWGARTGWNPFDLTKVWPHRDFPLQPAGVLELNRNPVNYHAE
ncbi:catalase, partial [Rheinheimera maricola]